MKSVILCTLQVANVQPVRKVAHPHKSLYICAAFPPTVGFFLLFFCIPLADCIVLLNKYYYYYYYYTVVKRVHQCMFS